MNKYTAALRIGLSSAMEYRFNFFVNLLSTVFPILIQVFLWQAIYSGGETRYGYTFGQMMVYVVVAGAVSMFVNTGVERVVNQDIRSGTLGIYLGKPINYILFRIFHTLGGRIPAAVTMILFTIATLTGLYFTVGLSISLVAGLLFILSLLLGILLNFCIFFLISLSAFWLTDVGSFFGAIRVTVMVISGGVFPVTVFGSTYMSVIAYLPFSYTTYFPITLLTGSMMAERMLTGILTQIFWIVLLGILSKVVWTAGTKRYVAVGG